MASIIGTLSSASWNVYQAAMRVKYKSQLPALDQQAHEIVEALRKEVAELREQLMVLRRELGLKS